MDGRVDKHLSTLEYLKTAKPKLRKLILHESDIDLIRCICDCCHNTLNGNIQLTPKEKKSLNRHKRHIRKLTSKRISLKEKRGILEQEGGFLPALLTPILGIAASLIGSLLNNG